MRHFVVFSYTSNAKGNQHGGRKLDDLQNWLDMTSHENPLLYKNNARALLLRIRLAATCA